MHLGGVIAVGLMPLLAGLGFLIHGGMAPLTWEDGHPPTRLTNERWYLPLFVGGLSLTCLLLGWTNLFFASRSACPTFTGTVTQLQWVPAKSGWMTQFNLHGDDGSDHAIVVHRYIRWLQWGDRATVVMRTYDDEVLALNILTGYRSGLQLAFPPRDLSFAVFMTIFGVACGGLAAGIATGRIKPGPRPRSTRPLAPWLARLGSGTSIEPGPGDKR